MTPRSFSRAAARSGDSSRSRPACSRAASSWPSASAPTRFATDRLHFVYRGVYAVGRPQVSRHGTWVAALLACGSEAVLCHQSAAELLGIRRARPGLIHVSVPAHVLRRVPGVEVHRRAALRVAAHEGIPATSPADTLIDLAVGLPRAALETAINEADKHDLIDPETLREVLADTAPRPGVRALRDLLDRATFRLTESELERYFLPVVRRVGYPSPRLASRSAASRSTSSGPASDS